MFFRPVRDRIARGAWLACCIVGWASLAPGSRALATPADLHPPRVDSAPRIDGWIDEPLWKQAAVASDFVQQRPESGAPASAPTEVRVAYTKDALYVAFVCHEAEPERILHRALGRDASLSDDDYFVLVLDTFADRQNGVLFQVNPNGARTDVDFRNQGESRNEAWDGIWAARARITETGWQGEIEIPWRTLRFAEGDRVNMGINFERQRRWKNEQAQWAPVPRQYSVYRVSEAGTMRGLEGLRHGLQTTVRPYVLGRVERGSLDDPQAFDAEDWKSTADVGLDAKIGLASNFTLDVTVNTDFAQVEVDDEVVNLTRFPLFFPEKREFFLEKANLFDFGSPANRLFFSRRIGLDDRGREIPLQYGLRLTGKEDRVEMGLLDMQQDAGGGLPSRHFNVARVKRDVGANSSVGVMAVQRASGDDGEFDEPTNRAIGADADFLPHRSFLLSAYVAASDEEGDGTDTGTWGGRARWSHPLTVLTVLHETVGTGYRPAMGFSPRGSMEDTAVGWEFTPEPNWKWIRRFENQGFVEWVSRRHGPFESRYIHVNPVVVGPSEERLSVYWERDFERLFDPFGLGDVVFDAGDYHFDYWGLELSTDPSRTFVFELEGEKGDFFDGRQLRYDARLSGQYAPHWGVQLEWERRHVEGFDENGRDAEFDSDIARVRLAYDLSNQFGLDLFTQWSTRDEFVLSQLRAHWIFGDESDLYFVVSDGRDDQRGRWTPRRSEMTLKLSYARQL